MSELPKFMLKPLRSGYGFSLGRDTLTTQTQSGMPRQRKDSVGTPHQLTANYKCTRAQHQYLLAFLRAYEAQAFLAYLLLDDIDHHWYECRIINEQIPINTLGDQIFSVKLQLVVKPMRYDSQVDVDLVTLYEMTDGQIAEYFNALERLVNEKLPQINGEQ